MTRKIIHIDADAFFASVEIRDQPALQHRPVAVGGTPGGRGVVATCNYVARRFGVRSAMPSATALRLCPDLLFLKPRFEVYRQVSMQMRAIFALYTDLIEPLSLDEAFLDVSDSNTCQGSATRIAEAIRHQVRDETGVTVSAGIAPNKFLAKIASDWNKPDGQFVIAPADVAAFLVQLPVERIPGVGRVTAAQLHGMGIRTCGDLQRWPAIELEKHFGSYGARLAQLAHGQDDRPVSSHRIRKSISTESTFSQDLVEEEDLVQRLDQLLDTLQSRLLRLPDDVLFRSRFVKVKFSNFVHTVTESSCRCGPADWRDRETYQQLLGEALLRARLPVRLLGAGLRLHHAEGAGRHARQLELFTDLGQKQVPPESYPINAELHS